MCCKQYTRCHEAQGCEFVYKVKKLFVVGASSMKWFGQKVIYISELWQEHWGTVLMIWASDASFEVIQKDFNCIDTHYFKQYMNASKEEPPLDIEPAQVTMEHEELIVPVIYPEPKSEESVSYVSMSLYNVAVV